MKKYTKFCISVASATLFLLAILLFFAPFAELKGLAQESGFVIAFGQSKVNANPTGTIFALIFLFLGLMSSILCCVGTFPKGKLQIKELPYPLNVRLAIHAVSYVGIYGLLPMILILCSVNTAYGEMASVISLGGGAIASALIALVAGCTLFVAQSGLLDKKR